MACGSFGAKVGRTAGGLGAMAAGFAGTGVGGFAGEGSVGTFAFTSIGWARLSDVEESSLCSSLTVSLRYFRPILYLTLRSRFSVCSTIGAAAEGVSTAPIVPSRLTCRMTLTRC